MTRPSALPAGADVLETARAAVLAAMLAPTADAAWAAALTVVMAGVDVTSMARARVEVRPVLELGEVAAMLAVMLGRREALILTDAEYAGAAHQPLPRVAEDGGTGDG